ncbi:pitrilysin family protein [Porphyromonas sp. oral taxon 275]|uniref:M16 family metallopeptidase n=1 Tax=Porphyromonas sp. oral taxon 275 TaxID=712435 RepID=UPI001BA4441D|nr:insulinase family protein [Porphyromonas sp. oral taxon 275]QUB43487.1 insulinase family protein [Porphyromonas sp. oral taxon 275]
MTIKTPQATRLAKRILIAAAVGGLSFASLAAQVSTLRTGRLPNGLTYYISRDAGASQGTAHFFLLQNVGAILEGEQQNGLAHYLEHMAFEATEHFPGGVMNFLRARGLYSFDARTGTDDTRYSILDVPTAERGLTDSVLLILKDWCNGISITEKDTEKQRGIIIEEWRQRGGIDKRLSDSIAGVIYNGSQYARRNVIGSLDVLKTFKYRDIQAFYKTWYRPDLQCVIIVGDIDPAAYEQQVQKLFSSLPAARKAKERPAFTIADNEQPLYYRFIDKENRFHSYGLYQRVATPTNRSTAEATKDYLLGQLFNTLAPQFFARLRNNGEEANIAVSVSYSPLVRGYAQFAWDFVPYSGQDEYAFAQILMSRAMIPYDFIIDEAFKAEKQKLYEGMKEVLSDDKGLGTPQNFIDIYRNNYLYGTPMREFRQQLEDNLEALVELEADDLRAWLKERAMGDRNLAFVAYTNSPEAEAISEQDFRRQLAEHNGPGVYASMIDFTPITKLIDFELPAGKITQEKKIPALGATEWTLSNGMKVIYKNLAKELKGEVLFLASAKGGQSIVKPRDLASFSAMQSLIMASGLYKYNRNQLAQWLRRRPMEVNLSITEYMDGMQARSKTDGVDDLFSYLYLVLNKQQFNYLIFNKWLQRKRYIYASQPQQGREAVDREIRELLNPITEANPREDQAFYDKMNLHDVRRLYEEHFGDASQMAGCLVGDISEAEAKRIVTTYLAALPGDPKAPRRSYTIRDHSSRERVIERTFEVDTEGDLGEVELSFLGDKKLSERERLALGLLEPLLQNRLFDELREKEQGTYSIAVKTSYTDEPLASSSLSIHFITSRAKADHLKARTYEILRSIAAGKIDRDEYKKVHIPQVLDEEAEEKAAGNELGLGDWIALLNAYAETGKAPDLSKKAPGQEVKVSAVTAQDLSALLKKLLDEGKRRDIVVKSIAPEAKTWEH